MKTLAKPSGISVLDWKISRKKAALIQEAYESGKKWDTLIYISSKEFYELITDRNGNPLFSLKAEIKVADNQNIKKWVHQMIVEARAYLKNNLISPAKKVLKTLEHIAPNHSEYLLLKAYYYYTLNQNQSAWKVLCNLLSKHPKNHRAYFLRAQLLKRSGRAKDALIDVNMALSVAAPSAETLMLKHELLSVLNKRALLQKSIETHKDAFNKLSYQLALSHHIAQLSGSNIGLSYLLSLQPHYDAQPKYHLAVAKLAIKVSNTSLVWKHAYLAKETGAEEAKLFWEALKQPNASQKAA